MTSPPTPGISRTPLRTGCRYACCSRPLYNHADGLPLTSAAPKVMPASSSFAISMALSRSSTRSCPMRARWLRRLDSSAISRFNGITLLSFEIQCFVDDRPILRMTTSFGFFVESALASQAGLPTSEADKRYLDEPANLAVNLRSQPAEYFGGPASMPQKGLAMLDRVTGFWPQAGAAGLGRLRAEKDVDPEEWFFKAHFFQDPVMPGTLGIESMTQLLQFYMLQSRLDAGLETPRFEVLTQSTSLSWKYRGQVLPHRKLVTVEVEIREVIREAATSPSLRMDGSGSMACASINAAASLGVSCRLLPSVIRLRYNDSLSTPTAIHGYRTIVQTSLFPPCR